MKITQVDAFAEAPFTGNPAAVCILDEARPDVWMRHVAMEMNLSETAFVTPRGDGTWGLRWFTPTTEVDLCGHATLAAAHVLWEEGHLPQDAEARFHTRSGLLTARFGRDGWITMDFPGEPPEEMPVPQALSEALGVPFTYVGKNRMYYLVALEDQAAVAEAQPDMRALRSVDAVGVIVTAEAGDEPCDFVSRFFAPRAGVPEDPVTGSAHCALAPYWAERLGKKAMVGYQLSARRGVVRVALQPGRVLLGGQAVTVLRGTLLA